jgi:hypothetical protein
MQKHVYSIALMLIDFIYKFMYLSAFSDLIPIERPQYHLGLGFLDKEGPGDPQPL